MAVDSLRAADIVPILMDNIAAEAIVMTGEAVQYRWLGGIFAGHGFTRHGAGQHVDLANPIIHTNTVEGAFSILKRGMGGIYRRRGKKHLHRYVADFEFRYSSREATGFNDRNRSEQAMRGILGKCLTYRTVGISA